MDSDNILIATSRGKIRKQMGEIPIDSVSREKAKARELRKSRWWQSRIAQATCYYCGKDLRPTEVTMDHIVPLARGGRSTPGNVVPCCKPCNNAKKDQTAVDLLLAGEQPRSPSS